MFDAALTHLPSRALTVFPTNGLLRQALPRDVESKGRWHCRDAEWSSRVGEWEHLALQPTAQTGSTILKEQPGKLVCLWRDSRHLAPDTVVKVTKAHRFDWRLNPRCRWDAEARNLLCAAERGVNVPRLYACGRFGSWTGPRQAALSMQYLPWQSLRDELASVPPEDEQWRMLQRAACLLQSLYQAGCLHIDFGPHAILLAPDSDCADAVIDWELAGFLAQPSPEVWAAQAGYFSWSVATHRSWISPNMLEAWFAEQLHEQRFANGDRLWSIWRKQFSERESTRCRLRWR